MKSDHFESNPGINIQKAPSSGNCKHCRTAPETGILAGPSLPGKQIFAEIYGFILVSPEHTGGLNNHKLLFKVEKCNKQSKGLIPDLQTTTDSKQAMLQPRLLIWHACIPGANPLRLLTPETLRL